MVTRGRCAGTYMRTQSERTIMSATHTSGADTPSEMHEVERGSLRQAIVGAGIGNTVEWYDFAIYGFLATYIAEKFFPSRSSCAR
jgi:hypothetical protein